MKASVVTLLLAGLVAAQDFSGQPDCAVPCLKDAIPKAGCSLTDTACQCRADTQAKLAGLVAPCLISKCSPSDLAKAQAAAAAACKKDTSGSSTEASSHTTEPPKETGSTTDSSAGAGSSSTTEAGSTTGPASTAATETTNTETTASETGSETTGPASTHTSAGQTSPTSGPGGVSNSTTSGVRSVVTRTSTAFVGGEGAGSKTSGVPASTTLAGGNGASAPVAGILGAVLAALVAL